MAVAQGDNLATAVGVVIAAQGEGLRWVLADMGGVAASRVLITSALATPPQEVVTAHNHCVANNFLPASRANATTRLRALTAASVH